LISIRFEFDSGGLPRYCRIAGHAGAAFRGSDVVCAAISVLARTLVRSFSDRQGVEIAASAPERGVFEFSAAYDVPEQDFLAGAASFALEGFKSIAEEYPEFISLEFIQV
jgi:uncharacterized protein YsxB (DUF464 family)